MRSSSWPAFCRYFCGFLLSVLAVGGLTGCASFQNRNDAHMVWFDCLHQNGAGTKEQVQQCGHFENCGLW